VKPVVTATARRDLFVLLATSRVRFGEEAQHRYRLLLEQAIADVATDPRRPGVGRLDEMPGEVWVYHSRRAVTRLQPAHRVHRPRHVPVFRLRGENLEILRILHDAMDLPRHIVES
jgi:toxin ParE1/3/4